MAALHNIHDSVKFKAYQLKNDETITIVIILNNNPNFSSAQKANVLANSPASCQLFCKEAPRRLEQQLQEHR